jgi:hypothetical protein
MTIIFNNYLGFLFNLVKNIINFGRPHFYLLLFMSLILVQNFLFSPNRSLKFIYSYKINFICVFLIFSFKVILFFLFQFLLNFSLNQILLSKVIIIMVINLFISYSKIIIVVRQSEVNALCNINNYVDSFRRKCFRINYNMNIILRVIIDEVIIVPTRINVFRNKHL